MLLLYSIVALRTYPPSHQRRLIFISELGPVGCQLSSVDRCVGMHEHREQLTAKLEHRAHAAGDLYIKRHGYAALYEAKAQKRVCIPRLLLSIAWCERRK